MKIRIAILDTDENYRNRLLSNLQINYADRLELYVFSNPGQMYDRLKEKPIDVILVSEDIEFAKERLPGSIISARLCGSANISELDGIPAICKYQKVETIYKQILGLYAEISQGDRSDIKTPGRIVLFVSAQGGSGVSSVAAAYALCRAEQQQICYLNLEQFGSSGMYFSGDGNMSFSDAIYALKSRKGDLAIKLESTMKTDRSGVDFFDTCRNAYDMMELKDEEIERLLQGVEGVKEYKDIVIDLSGKLDNRMCMLMGEYASRIVCVSTASRTGNDKFLKFCEALRVVEQRTEKNILGKMALLYNQYSPRNGEKLLESPVPVLGGIHSYEGSSGRTLIEMIARDPVLSQI